MQFLSEKQEIKQILYASSSVLIQIQGTLKCKYILSLLKLPKQPFKSNTFVKNLVTMQKNISIRHWSPPQPYRKKFAAVWNKIQNRIQKNSQPYPCQSTCYRNKKPKKNALSPIANKTLIINILQINHFKKSFFTGKCAWL